MLCLLYYVKRVLCMTKLGFILIKCRHSPSEKDQKILMNNISSVALYSAMRCWLTHLLRCRFKAGFCPNWVGYASMPPTRCQANSMPKYIVKLPNCCLIVVYWWCRHRVGGIEFAWHRVGPFPPKRSPGNGTAALVVEM